MKRLIVFGLFFAWGSAQAALVDRGGGFIYDDVLDITWTQNAFINSSDGWYQQVAWADSLTIYDAVRDVTWDDWRLASMDVNGDNAIINCTASNEVACRDNELGYMYWQNHITPDNQGPFVSVRRGAYWSGTSSITNTNNAWATNFVDGNQGQMGKFIGAAGDANDDLAFGWAVRDGDVAASVVPIPAAVWLFVSGLGLLGWMRRRQSA